MDHSTIGRLGICDMYRNYMSVCGRRFIGPITAGVRTYLYRAVESAGEPIDFRLSRKRDAVAAKHFLRTAIWPTGQILPHVINVDGHAAYPPATTELKASGELAGIANAIGPPIEIMCWSRIIIREEANGGEPLVSFRGWSLANNRRFRSDEHDPQGAGEIGGQRAMCSDGYGSSSGPSASLGKVYFFALRAMHVSLMRLETKYLCFRGPVASQWC